MKIVMFVNSPDFFPCFKDKKDLAFFTVPTVPVAGDDSMLLLRETKDLKSYEKSISHFAIPSDEVIRIYHLSDPAELDAQKKSFSSWRRDILYSRAGGPDQVPWDLACQSVSNGTAKPLVDYVSGCYTESKAMELLWYLAMAYFASSKGQGAESPHDLNDKAYSLARKELGQWTINGAQYSPADHVADYFRALTRTQLRDAKEIYSNLRDQLASRIANLKNQNQNPAERA